MNTTKEFFNRLKGNTPLFFKKLISLGLWLVSTGVGLTAVPAIMEQTVPGFTADLSLLSTISSYMILAGTVLGIVAKLPVKDPNYENLDK